MIIKQRKHLLEVPYDPFIYWEERSHEWVQGDYPNHPWEDVLRQYIRPDAKVLELGCGTGRWSVLSRNYTGADISPTMLEYARKGYPTATFAHHDMRYDVTGDWEVIFTYTAWLHVPPKDIARVKLPDCTYLFIEPHQASESEHCFAHDYQKLFGCTRLKTIDQLTLYGRII